MADDDYGNAPFRRLNLNLAYPLAAILHSRTLKEAGDLIGLTQPAMSLALKRLREHFGDELVVYSRGERCLTAFAEQIRPVARGLLRDAEQMFRFKPGFDPATEIRTVSFSAYETVEMVILAHALPRLAREAPGVTFRFVPYDPSDPIRAIERGADIVFAPSEFADQRLSRRDLFNEWLACLVARDHPHIGDRLSVDEYLGARHIAAIGSPPSPRPEDAFERQLLASRRVVVETSHHGTMAGIVAVSDLVATVGAGLAQFYAAMLPVRVVTAPFAYRGGQVIAQWLPHRSHDPLIAWILDSVHLGMRSATPR